MWPNFTRKLDVSRFHMIFPGRLSMHIASTYTIQFDIIQFNGALSSICISECGWLD